MLARVGRLKPKHGLLALVSVVLGACAGVLGIEERTLDTASTYPLEGYDGCRPGASCEGCLEVHRPECNVRTTCADPQSLGSCGACACDNCIEPVVDCQLDAGCAAIWQCLQQTRCDLSETAPRSCVRECQSVIEANGGLSGHAFNAAVAIRSCAVSAACLSCLPESPAPPPGCRPQNGCADCADCFLQCLCSGDTFSNCRAACGDASPEACSEQDDCVGCSSCFDVCVCGGADFASCNAQCQEQEPDACAAGTNCLTCDGCVSHCVCSGGGLAQCQQACEPPVTSDVCRESTQGETNTSCGGCSSCLATCTCGGDELEACMAECGLPGCCGDLTGCESELDACACGAGVRECVKDYACELGACDSCACSNCHDTFALCQETRGCDRIFDCMRTTECQGGVCAARCANANNGDQAPSAFDIAESLWACSQRAGCACADEIAFAATCGTTTCNPYVGVNAGLDACCPEIREETGPVPAAIGSDSCGLTLQRYFPDSAPSCSPLDQQSPPQGLESCPSVVIANPPYNGAALRGCCRSADGLCGYWDDITGLGCLDPGTFGASTQGCL
jgi:hypothetical protein